MRNLSTVTLSRYHTSILIHGLKFTSKPTINNIHLKSDIYNFFHKLRLAEFFENMSENAYNNDISSQPLVQN